MDINSSERGSERFLVFSMAGQEYGIPLLKVKEVIAVPQITNIPDVPSYFKGIMNLRGQIISAIDLKMKFGLPSADVPKEGGMIVLDLDSLFFGVLVDSIDSVLSVESDHLRPVPNSDLPPQRRCIASAAQKGENLVLILDVERTLSVADKDTIAKKVSTAKAS